MPPGIPQAAALELRASVPPELAPRFEPPPGAGWFGLELVGDDDTWQRLDRAEWGKAARWWSAADEHPLEIALRNGPGVYRVLWTKPDRRHPISTAAAWMITEDDRLVGVDLPEDAATAEHEEQHAIAMPLPTEGSGPRPPQPPPPQRRAGIPPPPPAPPPPPPSGSIAGWLPAGATTDHPLTIFAAISALEAERNRQHQQFIATFALAAVEAERERGRHAVEAITAQSGTLLRFFEAVIASRQPNTDAVQAMVSPIATQVAELRGRLDEEDAELDDADLEARMREILEASREPTKLETLMGVVGMLANGPLAGPLSKLIERMAQEAGAAAGEAAE